MDTELKNRLFNIPWFAACGERLTVAIPISVIPVRSWKEAQTLLTLPTWEEVELEAQNELTVYLHANCRDEYRRWNEIVIAAKEECINLLVEKVWRPFASRNDLGPTLVECVSWDVLGAVMEHEYRQVVGRPRYFTYLLDIYEAGHMVCGWQGNWPSGGLYVY